MGPAVHVDTTSPVPPYEQIRAQLAALIVTGRLTEGERLPTVRQLAALARDFASVARAVGADTQAIPAAVRKDLD
ncbi:GntR family transcriptional regulator (plasmid) [Streptomyces sp. BHT-5-2]|nr:GntR family transcriptional regulator [Streptomyces sp. BHT-5-2]